jgi:hypothetical protein
MHHKSGFFAGQLKDEQFNIILRMIISGDFSQDFGLNPSFWIEHRDETYLVVLTIARRREPFANCKEIRVSLELIGENFTILPVTPVLLVVNKSPIWYVYPPRVILFPFLFVVFVLFNFTRF